MSRNACSRMHFLGYIVGDGRLETDPKMIEAVRHYPIPKNKMELPTRRTTRHRINAAGLQSLRAAIKEVLTEVHHAARLAFAQTYLRKDEDFWRKVIFSDEKTFLSTSSRPVHV
ncbi:hypothetical protein J437_LFUL005344 [Ladona fulva]|uniref:Uncharacterized protein n=1 Tax=Ladona fulva TaxID=123851 RepID=A0A8K0K0X7_LADFU|nr:hypothetical protein J437_LFUL005344 [Ladona fulva]